MKTIAVISQKGGSGKSTLSLHLGVAAEHDGTSAVIIDLDPQASATTWGDIRGSDVPVIVSAQASRLTQVLAAAQKHGAQLAIIDTAPHSESAALAAARVADLILIPCRPAILDLRAIELTVDLVKLARKPAVIVLNAVPPRGSIGDDAVHAVECYGLPVAPARICQRAAFVHCLTAGQTAQEYEPAGRAAEEIAHLYRWTCTQVGLDVGEVQQYA